MGYGIIGACEEQDDYEIRKQFEMGFMGTVNILGGSLGYFRTRGMPGQAGNVKNEERSTTSPEDIEAQATPIGGRYLFFSHTCGVPGLGPYSASKYAVEGLVE
ncbi:MAG: hypothetical protein Q9226_009335, partial [Calogaya cf. arnoldii]